MGKAYFVSGIDTDAGKTYATGVLAARMLKDGRSVITQKFVQTGCGETVDAVSDDIVIHRTIMGTGLLPEDIDGITCSQKFSYPASPDLAARLDGRKVDRGKITVNTAKLLWEYDIVLIEGAGGLMVPIDGADTIIDYIVLERLPLILITNPRLGSLNHTLLSLEACRKKEVEVCKLVYNHHPVTSDIITTDTRSYLKNYLARHFPFCSFEEVPRIDNPATYDPAMDPYYMGAG